MLLFLQILTILAMLAGTYLVFQILGPRRATLLYTPDEKAAWDAAISKPIGTWFALTNIVGTLTSLATAYLFFIGNSKVFGYWIIVCCVTLFLGAFVTNSITRAIMKMPAISALFDSNEQRLGVIATLFWGSDRISQRNAWLIKWISIANILGVIWLEFALFADISRQLMGGASLFWYAVGLAAISGIVIDFTIRYGLRGFVFADAFQAPLVALATFMLLIGSIIHFFDPSKPAAIPRDWYQPLLPLRDCVLFALHVLCLNAFLVVVTEPHWLRVWAFRQKETEVQVRSLAATSGIWLLLIAVGFCAFVTTGKVGEESIVGLLTALYETSPVFVVAFWVGGMAALFSTADGQIYSWLLVTDFDTATGRLRNRLISELRPHLWGVVAGIMFGTAYYLVRYFDIPFEKIVFVVIPLCLNAIPAFALLCAGKRPHPAFTLASLILYSAAAIYGFVQPEDQFTATLLAGLMPILVASVALVTNYRSRGLDRAND